MKLIALDYNLQGHQISRRVEDLDPRHFTPAQNDHLANGIGVTTISCRGRTDYQPARSRRAPNEQNLTKPMRKRKVTEKKPRKLTRQERLMELIRRDIGVSLSELVGEFGIQRHTARAYISAVSRKHNVKAALREGRYHLHEEPGSKDLPRRRAGSLLPPSPLAEGPNN